MLGVLGLRWAVMIKKLGIASCYLPPEPWECCHGDLVVNVLFWALWWSSVCRPLHSVIWWAQPLVPRRKNDVGLINCDWMMNDIALCIAINIFLQIHHFPNIIMRTYHGCVGVPTAYGSLEWHFNNITDWESDRQWGGCKNLTHSPCSLLVKYDGWCGWFEFCMFVFYLYWKFSHSWTVLLIIITMKPFLWSHCLCVLE